MIARQWTGICYTEKAVSYIQHLQTEIFPQLHSIEGFINASIFHRELSNGIEFVITTIWESVESIAAFAGIDHERAVVPVVVQDMMINYDHSVRYYKFIALTPPQ